MAKLYLNYILFFEFRFEFYIFILLEYNAIIEKLNIENIQYRISMENMENNESNFQDVNYNIIS